MHRLRHRGDIRGQVERVGRQQQSDHGPQHYWRKIALDVGGQAARVTQPMRALTSWIATISGSVSGMVHSIA